MKTVLVTGASGKLGSLVIQDLLKSKKVKIIATTRSVAKLTSLHEAGVSVRAANFSEPQNLTAAFQGASSLLLISTDELGSRVAQHKNAIEAAVKAGVKHIVYTSWPSPETSLASVGAEHAATEELIKKSGLSYTILRNFNYADNLLHTIETAKSMGALYGSAGAGKVAYVTRQDCAHAAAAALISDSDKNQILNITGPEALSYEDVARLASEFTQQDIKYKDLPAEEFKAGLTKSGLPEVWAELFVSFDLAARAQEGSQTSSSVFDLTGKKPQALKEFLKANLK
jgi:NAD(P)H dehydrogenase (quinone)